MTLAHVAKQKQAKAASNAHACQGPLRARIEQVLAGPGAGAAGLARQSNPCQTNAVMLISGLHLLTLLTQICQPLPEATNSRAGPTSQEHFDSSARRKYNLRNCEGHLDPAKY